MNGILVVNKPKGMTSHQVVGKVRRILGIKKIGHAGTLDPDVDGVLPLCVGSATRIAEYMLDQSKAYIGEVTFGFSTDTQDASGTVLERLETVSLNEEQVRRAFSQFHGEIEQIPPAYSAIKVGGKRAYDLARRGETVVLKPRRVTIHSLEILAMELQQNHPRVRFRVECSKGTYVRTLCRDIGQKLGVPAHMSALTRIRSGPFTLEMSHTLEEIERAQSEGGIERLLLSASVAVRNFPVYVVGDKQAGRVRNGMEMTFPVGSRVPETGERVRVEIPSGKLLAIYRVVGIDGQTVRTKPEKVFKE